MANENQEPKPATHMDTLKQQAEACGAGCCCHANATPGRRRWLLGAVILLLAAALVARALLKTTTTTTDCPSTAAVAFAAPVKAGQASATTPAAVAAAPAQAVTATGGTEIASFDELNALAADTTAVLVFVPGKTPDAATPPTAQMEAAARTIAAQGSNKVGLFTLKASGPDYEQLTGQVTVPGVLALVKGKGMNAVSGEITETKLVQAFVAASSSAGCGAGGCAPGTPGCK